MVVLVKEKIMYAIVYRQLPRHTDEPWTEAFAKGTESLTEAISQAKKLNNIPRMSYWVVPTFILVGTPGHRKYFGPFSPRFIVGREKGSIYPFHVLFPHVDMHGSLDGYLTFVRTLYPSKEFKSVPMSSLTLGPDGVYQFEPVPVTSHESES
jgi:hypothetical protein